MASKNRYPMQVAARRAGLRPERLRAWERRHGAVRPARSPSGQRLYSDQDIARLRLLQRALSQGYRIGQVATLDDLELTTLLRQEIPEAGNGTGNGTRPGLEETYVDRALRAVGRLDSRELQDVLERAMIALDSRSMVDGVIVPLMKSVGDLWWRGRLGISHEHLASAVVKGTVARMSPGLEAAQPAGDLVVCTPRGQRHEIGAMLAAAVAASEGWRVTYLGADLTSAEIASAVHRTGAVAVAMSLVHPRDDAHLGPRLRELYEAVPPSTSILVGGSAAEAYAEVLEQIQAIRVPSLERLRAVLEDVSRGQATASPRRSA